MTVPAGVVEALDAARAGPLGRPKFKKLSYTKKAVGPKDSGWQETADYEALPGGLLRNRVAVVGDPASYLYLSFDGLFNLKLRVRRPYAPRSTTPQASSSSSFRPS